MYLPPSVLRRVAALLCASWLALPSGWLAADSSRTFATPADAIAALDRAVNAGDRDELAALFGPSADRLVNPDAVQGAAEFAEFTAAFNTSHQLVPGSNRQLILEVGSDAWPFPIPLVQDADGWQFDGAAGVEELLNRRIGRNELHVLRVLRACVQAQREYASRDRDGDGVLEFAARIVSSPGRTDGLYWPPELNGEISPLGPLVADAQAEGYRAPSAADAPQPFHGYFFKLLPRQGPHAPGGAYHYNINGNRIGGFAFVAWPAAYGESGIMTFIVSHQGRIYERDLGPRTARQVRRLTAYDPGTGWRLAED